MKKQTHITLGIILVFLSSILYGVEIYFELETDDSPFSGLFFIHYLLAIGYFVIAKNKLENFWRFFQKENFSTQTLLLILFNISAYSLNQSIPVFNESANWLVVFLCIENGLLLIYVTLLKPSKEFQYVMIFFMTIALIFNVYQTFMVLPTAPFGIMGTPFLGISLLLFVPLFYIACIVTMFRAMQWSVVHKTAAGFGLTISILVIAVFSIHWKNAESTIQSSKLAQDAPYAQVQDLPDWISIAQVIDATYLTEKYLKAGLVYQVFNDGNGFSSIWRSPLDEKYIHDPLVTIASIFSKKNTLDEMTKIKILNYLYDARHQTSDRFWSGENLKSKQVVTNIELFPEERLSFTEQVITIENSRVNQSRWRNQQEALYTFDLPEGGVVTSMSLWIEGQEAKAVLTSKKKAEKAYNTIVGREQRDPSVVYWMEGNKIRVRVFPCTPTEDRKFKIGITAPLSLMGDQLVYQSIGFKGPDYSHANSAIFVVTHDADITQSTLDFDESALYHQWEGGYTRDWYLKIDKPNFVKSGFSHGNQHFMIEKSATYRKNFIPQKVYLDVSNAWTPQELITIADMVKGMDVYGFTTHLKKKSSSNAIVRMSDVDLPTFTLFPFHQVDLNQAIVITKGDNATPNLSDLKNTPFREKLFKYFHDQDSAPMVIDIGSKPSGYIKSLKEFGVIAYHKLTLQQLATCFQSNQFPEVNFDTNVTVIPENGLSIKRLDSALMNGGQASDHIMRLFYYQLVMHDIGKNFFAEDQNEYIENEIVDNAATANIVTPLSSLIVLESQQDYDRFDIKKKTDSLGNASISNAGAVPEPHEWALIIVGIGLLFFMYWKSNKSTLTL